VSWRAQAFNALSSPEITREAFAQGFSSNGRLAPASINTRSRMGYATTIVGLAFPNTKLNIVDTVFGTPVSVWAGTPDTRVIEGAGGKCGYGSRFR
jgi:hypothetical protein